MGQSRGVAARLEHVFEVVRNPSTGEPYTNAEVARMTLGDLSEEDVEKIRTGADSDPTVGQVAALAGVFGVEPSYLLDRGEPVYDGSSWGHCETKRSGRQPARSRACPSGRGGWCWGSCGSSVAPAIPGPAQNQGRLSPPKLQRSGGAE
jgi:hypothetical protein